MVWTARVSVSSLQTEHSIYRTTWSWQVWLKISDCAILWFHNVSMQVRFGVQLACFLHSLSSTVNWFNAKNEIDLGLCYRNERLNLLSIDICATMPATERNSCGFDTMTEEQCLLIGCCWNASTPSVPPCFLQRVATGKSVLHSQVAFCRFC